MSDIRKQIVSHYTTIGQTFNLELMFIKICGGFMFDTGSSYINILYRFCIIVFTRFLNFRHHSKYPKEFESFSKAAWQNVRLFWFSYHFISHVTVFVCLLTGIRYHNLVSVILKKRFDIKYLDVDMSVEVAATGRDESSGSPSNPISVAGGASMGNRDSSTGAAAPCEYNNKNNNLNYDKEASVSKSPTITVMESGNENGNRTTTTSNSVPVSVGGNQDVTFINQNIRNDNKNSRATTKSRNLRVKMVRNFLIANILLTTLSSFLRDQTYSRFQSIASQQNSTTSSNDELSSPIPNFIAPIFIRVPLRYFRQNQSPTSLGTGNTSNNRTSRRTSLQRWYYNKRQHLKHQFNSTDWIKRFGLSKWLEANFLPPIVPRTILILGYILFAFIEAALNINQTYGQLFIVLMVTATITDMLNYSCHHDGLISRKELDQINSNKHDDRYKITGAPQNGEDIEVGGDEMVREKEEEEEEEEEKAKAEAEVEGPARSHLLERSGRPKRKPLLTTELLVQARDVLIVLRCTMGLDYLMLLIFELARLMSIFCMFNAAITTGRVDAILLICIDYISIAFSMSLTRLGYHWLHDQVRKLKRMVDETTLLMNTSANTSENEKTTTLNNSTYSNKNNNNNQTSNNSSASIKDHSDPLFVDDNITSISQSEMITTYRLADHIEGLWPTDWFTPDLKGYLKHNIFVITFVATLQQLVEAASRFEYQPNDQDETIQPTNR